MKRLGWETNETEQILELFKRSLAMFEEHLHLLEAAGENYPAADSHSDRPMAKHGSSVAGYGVSLRGDI